MSPTDDRPADLESQGSGTDPHGADAKPHRVLAGSHHWEGEAPVGDPGVHRKHLEPGLAALLQAEHVSLLVGSGLTTAIAKLARAAPVDMKAVPFGCDLAEAVDGAAADSASPTFAHVKGW